MIKDEGAKEYFGQEISYVYREFLPCLRQDMSFVLGWTRPLFVRVSHIHSRYITYIGAGLARILGHTLGHLCVGTRNVLCLRKDMYSRQDTSFVLGRTYILFKA